MLRGPLLKLALVAGSLIFSLLLGELVLQIAVPLVFRPRFTRIDPALGWYHNASVTNPEECEGHRYKLSYNSHGFRPPEHTYDKPDGIRRVVVLGDSFTDGSEVGDRELFTWYLQNCLDATEVINLGVYGYSTAQELIALENFGIRYSPDIVLMVTISNDFDENVVGLQSFGVAPRFVLDGEGLRFEGTDSASARSLFLQTNLPAPSIVHQHSLLYYFLNHYLYHRIAYGKISEVKEQRAAMLSPEDKAELYRRLVNRMREVTEQNGADLIVVFGYWRSELIQNEASPRSALARQLSNDGIQVVDLFEPLRQAELQSEPSLYYQEDIHWNTSGHRTIADLLSSVLRQQAAGRLSPTRPFAPSFGVDRCEMVAKTAALERS